MWPFKPNTRIYLSAPDCGREWATSGLLKDNDQPLTLRCSKTRGHSGQWHSGQGFTWHELAETGRVLMPWQPRRALEAEHA